MSTIISQPVFQCTLHNAINQLLLTTGHHDSLRFLFSQMLIEAKYTPFISQSNKKQVPSIVLQLTPTDDELLLDTVGEIFHLRQLNTGAIYLVHTSSCTEASRICKFDGTTYWLIPTVLDQGSECYHRSLIVPDNENEYYSWFYRRSQNESLLMLAAHGVGVT